jgi:hypothetical protein
MNEPQRTYVVFSEARYADACRSQTPPAWEEEIAFTVGGQGEMFMRWYRIERSLSPRLEVFCDGWRALANVTPELLVELAGVHNQDITPEFFRKILERCGFVDATLRA